jgi:hypothetical protein
VAGQNGPVKIWFTVRVVYGSINLLNKEGDRIMEKAIGAEGKLKAEMIGGKIKLSVVYDGAQVDGALSISSDSDLLVDAILELVPGDSAFEKTMGALLKTALKSISV